IIVNYSNSQRAGVILYLTALLFGAYKEGKVLEQNKIVYDVPAILLTMALVLFSFIMALVNLALITSRHIVIR
ncbi:hypothetical protein D3Z60_18015, partial [Lachnospiraceae bacterium]|nr:hypothetical protein [Lachnospiraceae bacterium]